LIDQQVLAALSRLSPLQAEERTGLDRPCKICHGHAPPFDVVDFKKMCSETNPYYFGFSGIPVGYYRCEKCGFMFTDFCDGWSGEDFASFIYNDDYIKVDPEYVDVRPTQQAEVAATFLQNSREARILDYGSGTGTFGVRLGERGFSDVVNYDPFSTPERPNGEFDIITCFEVLEHSVDPAGTLADIKSLLAPSGTVLFSTATQPLNINQVRAQWWYVGPRNGHISIFTIDALALLGQRVGLNLHLGGHWPAYRQFEQFSFPAASQDYFGWPVYPIILSAPETDAKESTSVINAVRQNDWQPAETSLKGRFRWTQSSQIHWLIDRSYAGSIIRVVIPYWIEITQGFAENCKIGFGQNIEPIALEGLKITATITLGSDFDGVITLHTPAPLSPAALGTGQDSRHLGLAIPIW
jgi:SAM-dependent methyltransferase